jgi:putative endonuclease
MRSSSSSRKRGADAERRARRYYRLRGYRILGENVWAGGNELDLVVRRGERLVFCEVKAKLGERFGEPAEMVDAEKQRRLRRAAEAWLARHPELASLEVRFDVVAVSPRGIQRIVIGFVLAALAASLLPAAADASRNPTRGERVAIAAAVKRKHPQAPASCYPLIMRVSTVNRNYASASYRGPVSCRTVVGDGVFVLRRVRRGLWRVLSGGSEHFCREAPRGVIRDLLGGCS